MRITSSLTALATLVTLVVAGCGGADAPAPAQPITNATSTPTPTWEEQAHDFTVALSEILLGDQDCEKVTDALEALAPAAHDLAAALEASGHVYKDYVFQPDAALETRIEEAESRQEGKSLLDRCESEGNPRFDAAINATLLTVQPLSFDGPPMEAGETGGASD